MTREKIVKDMSLQDAIQVLRDTNAFGTMDIAKSVILKALEQEQKIGHWISDVDKWGDIVTTVNGYRCDQCNTFNGFKDNFCPNCGAKMVEPQESEE